MRELAITGPHTNFRQQHWDLFQRVRLGRIEKVTQTLRKPLGDQLERITGRLRDMRFKSLGWMAAWDGAAGDLVRDALSGAMEDAILEAGLEHLELMREAVPDAQIPSGALPPPVAGANRAAMAELQRRDYYQTVASRYGQRIADVIQAGADQGMSFEEIADAIETLLGRGAAEYVAQGIAQTETGGWLNLAVYNNAMYLHEYGWVKGLEWTDMGDERVRDTHSIADGQQVFPGEMFDVGGHPARYPGDPALPIGERVNCRCTITPILAD